MRKSLHKYIASLAMMLLLLGSSADVFAQDVRIISEVNPASIRIGEQSALKIRVVYPHEGNARLILPKDTLTHGVEIVESHMVDSMTVNDKLRELVYEVTITSFDSATYLLNNISALVGDSLYTDEDPPHLVVNTIPVDTEHPEEFYDIKPQWKPPFVWKDYIIYLYIAIGVILIALLIYFIIKWLKKRKVDEERAEEVPLDDPYSEAMHSLEALRERRVWEQGQTKMYYTELTDIIRRYLWRVYDISTLDRTTAEILQEYKEHVGRERMYRELSELLQTSDLAKFAKYEPLAEVNNRMQTVAVAFVEEHKPEPEETTEEEGGKTGA
ncbi:MAG: hypothetical protein Q4D93_05310 [Porphyromonas sp.]|nr:hypothetical protein [Porphyromonas sp.]